MFTIEIIYFIFINFKFKRQSVQTNILFKYFTLRIEILSLKKSFKSVIFKYCVHHEY